MVLPTKYVRYFERTMDDGRTQYIVETHEVAFLFVDRRNQLIYAGACAQALDVAPDGAFTQQRTYQKKPTWYLDICGAGK